MTCEPSERLEVLSVATPPARGAEPRVVAPSRNITVPVGTPGDEGDTVTVSVTGWPKPAGFVCEASVVVVPARGVWFSSTPTALDEPMTKSGLPSLFRSARTTELGLCPAAVDHRKYTAGACSVASPLPSGMESAPVLPSQDW